MAGWVHAHARRRRLVLAIAAVAGTAALLGCGQPAAPATSQRLAVCVSPTDAMPAGKEVAVEMRQGETVVAAGSTAVGTVYQAEVPIGTDIDVFADGQLVGTGGSSQGNEGGGEGPTMYMSGPGCPATAPS